MKGWGNWKGERNTHRVSVYLLVSWEKERRSRVTEKLLMMQAILQVLPPHWPSEEEGGNTEKERGEGKGRT